MAKGSMARVFAKASKKCAGKPRKQFNVCRKKYIKKHG